MQRHPAFIESKSWVGSYHLGLVAKFGLFGGLSFFAFWQKKLEIML
jgi:hypothetical protein